MTMVRATLLAGAAAIGLAVAGSVHAARATQAPGAEATAPLTPSINLTIVEHVASLLETRYVYPEIGSQYARLLRANALRGDYASITDRDVLANRVTADLQAVHADGHLRVRPVRPAPAPPVPLPTPSASGAITANETERSIAPGIRAMKWVAPGIAYVSFEHLDDRPEAIAAVTRFLRDYSSAKALIIDSRDNHGGAFDMLGLFANNLFGDERHLADMDIAKGVVDALGTPFPVDGHILRRGAAPQGLVRFEHWSIPDRNSAWTHMPVYYLISHRTFSAAEHLAMILKTSRRAVLIGEATGGGNHFGGTEPIGGGLELFVPIGRTSDPATGRDWERVGVSPDVAVPADRALDEAIRRINAS